MPPPSMAAPTLRPKAKKRLRLHESPALMRRSSRVSRRVCGKSSDLHFVRDSKFKIRNGLLYSSKFLIQLGEIGRMGKILDDLQRVVRTGGQSAPISKLLGF